MPNLEIQTEIREKTTLHGIRDNIRAKLSYSKEAIEKAKRETIEFTSTFIDFLGENPSALLAPLYPDKAQLDNISLFIRSANDNLLHATNEKFLYIHKRAYMGKHYFASEAADDENSKSLKNTKSLSIWDMEQQFPTLFKTQGINFYGGITDDNLVIRYLNSDPISFAFSPFKIDSKESATKANPSFTEWQNVQKTQTIDNGKKIIISTQGSGRHRKTTYTINYHYLGEFSDENREYFLYGSNSKNNTQAKSPMRQRSFKFSHLKNPAAR